LPSTVPVRAEILRGILIEPIYLTKRQAMLYQTLRKDRLMSIWRAAELMDLSHRESVRFILDQNIPIFKIPPTPRGYWKVFASDIVKAIDKCLVDVKMDVGAAKRIRTVLLRYKAPSKDAYRRNRGAARRVRVEPDDE
jgi:hypothetical protein